MVLTAKSVEQLLHPSKKKSKSKSTDVEVSRQHVDGVFNNSPFLYNVPLYKGCSKDHYMLANIHAGKVIYQLFVGGKLFFQTYHCPAAEYMWLKHVPKLIASRSHSGYKHADDETFVELPDKGTRVSVKGVSMRHRALNADKYIWQGIHLPTGVTVLFDRSLDTSADCLAYRYTATLAVGSWVIEEYKGASLACLSRYANRFFITALDWADDTGAAIAPTVQQLMFTLVWMAIHG